MWHTINCTPYMQYQIEFKRDCSSLLYHIVVLGKNQQKFLPNEKVITNSSIMAG
jgi:hypothetical protein